MKKLLFIALFALSMISCKKETIEPVVKPIDDTTVYVKPKIQIDIKATYEVYIFCPHDLNVVTITKINLDSLSFKDSYCETRISRNLNLIPIDEVKQRSFNYNSLSTNDSTFFCSFRFEKKQGTYYIQSKLVFPNGSIYYSQILNVDLNGPEVP